MVDSLFYRRGRLVLLPKCFRDLGLVISLNKLTSFRPPPSLFGRSRRTPRETSDVRSTRESYFPYALFTLQTPHPQNSLFGVTYRGNPWDLIITTGNFQSDGHSYRRSLRWTDPLPTGPPSLPHPLILKRTTRPFSVLSSFNLLESESTIVPSDSRPDKNSWCVLLRWV